MAGFSLRNSWRLSKAAEGGGAATAARQAAERSERVELRGNRAKVNSGGDAEAAPASTGSLGREGKSAPRR